MNFYIRLINLICFACAVYYHNKLFTTYTTCYFPLFDNYIPEEEINFRAIPFCDSSVNRMKMNQLIDRMTTYMNNHDMLTASHLQVPIQVLMLKSNNQIIINPTIMLDMGNKIMKCAVASYSKHKERIKNRLYPITLSYINHTTWSTQIQKFQSEDICLIYEAIEIMLK
jgi:hypothetical protein